MYLRFSFLYKDLSTAAAVGIAILAAVLFVGSALVREGCFDIERARVPPGVGRRAVNLDRLRGGCQAALVQLQIVVAGVADDQGDRDHVLGHGMTPSWCAAAGSASSWRPGPRAAGAISRGPACGGARLAAPRPSSPGRKVPEVAVAPRQ